MIKPKKSLGQNFLIDNNIIKKIVLNIDIKDNNILEIGPGTGNLTKEIIKNNPKNLILIEKDFNLFEKIKKTYQFNKNIKVYNDDVLSINIEKIIKKNTIIFGNLPYNISTQILVKLIKFKKWPPKYNKLILMFQKEVADKLLAKYNSSNFGRLTVISNFRLCVINHFNFSKNCFFPKPKVKSTLLVFKPLVSNKYKITKLENLENITHEIFSRKRKMINKAFKKLFLDYIKVAKDLKIDLKIRPAQLKSETFYKIAQYFEKN